MSTGDVATFTYNDSEQTLALKVNETDHGVIFSGLGGGKDLAPVVGFYGSGSSSKPEWKLSKIEYTTTHISVPVTIDSDNGIDDNGPLNLCMALNLMNQLINAGDISLDSHLLDAMEKCTRFYHKLPVNLLNTALTIVSKIFNKLGNDESPNVMIQAIGKNTINFLQKVIDNGSAGSTNSVLFQGIVQVAVIVLNKLDISMVENGSSTQAENFFTAAVNGGQEKKAIRNRINTLGRLNKTLQNLRSNTSTAAVDNSLLKFICETIQKRFPTASSKEVLAKPWASFLLFSDKFVQYPTLAPLMTQSPEMEKSTPATSTSTTTSSTTTTIPPSGTPSFSFLSSTSAATSMSNGPLFASGDRTAALRVGDKVEANWRGNGIHYKGCVKKDNGDGTYDIDYNDGDKETRVPSNRIRPQPGNFSSNTAPSAPSLFGTAAPSLFGTAPASGTATTSTPNQPIVVGSSDSLTSPLDAPPATVIKGCCPICQLNVYATDERFRVEGIYYHQNCYEQRDRVVKGQCPVCQRNVYDTDERFKVESQYYHQECHEQNTKRRDSASGFFSFGAAPTPSSGSAETISFSFGPAPASGTAPSGSFSFGAVPATVSGTSTPGSFSFGAAPAPSSGSTETTSFSFGAAPASGTAPSGFGAASTPASGTPTPGFSFGAAPAPSSGSFGSAPASGTAPSGSFSFVAASTPASGTPTAGSFSFGAAPAPASGSAETTSFSFGSAPASGTASSGSFSFGAAPFGFSAASPALGAVTSSSLSPPLTVPGAVPLFGAAKTVSTSPSVLFGSSLSVAPPALAAATPGPSFESSTSGTTVAATVPPTSSLTVNHQGLMACKCPHDLGNVPFPLSSDKRHLNNCCKWLCCDVNWSEDTCTAAAGAPATSLGLTTSPVITPLPMTFGSGISNSTSVPANIFNQSGAGGGSGIFGQQNTPQPPTSGSTRPPFVAPQVPPVFGTATPGSFFFGAPPTFGAAASSSISGFQSQQQSFGSGNPAFSPPQVEFCKLLARKYV